MSDNNNTNYMLREEDLENISGGKTVKIQIMKIACIHCGIPFNVDVSKPSAICSNPKCKKINYFSG